MNQAESRAEHEPDPRFVEHLEWELMRSLRRESRFGQPVRGGPKRAGALALALLLALSAGASSVLAAQELRRSRAAELLGAQYQARLEIASLREAAAREDVERAELAHERGLIDERAVFAAQERHMTRSKEADLLDLDAAEVAATGREPDNRLSAALIAGADLVSQRLESELSALQFKRSIATQLVERAAIFHDAGRATHGELAQARLLEQELAGLVECVEHKLELRARYLRGGLDARRVDLLALRAEIQARLAQAQREHAHAKAALERSMVLAAAGLVLHEGQRAATEAVQSWEAEVRLAELDLATIADRLAEGR